MKQKKTIWTTITGGLSSAAPILFSCCKGGACVGVCVSPVASIFGVSSATIAASPIVSAVEPLLIAISAVSFTSSYYSLYVLPKYSNNNSCGTGNECGCAPNEKENRKIKITKLIFWLGLVLSIAFLSYFEYQKYQTATAQTECSASECAPGECSDDTETSSASSCGETCDSTSCK
jgi:hypothetical protein